MRVPASIGSSCPAVTNLGDRVFAFYFGRKRTKSGTHGLDTLFSPEPLRQEKHHPKVGLVTGYSFLAVSIDITEPLAPLNLSGVTYMPPLGSFRLGWQSENVARCILYNICFLAQPVQSADDIGIDFFCTLFQTEPTENNTQLIPKNSFAIQIKSKDASNRVSLTKYLPYLAALELPFFIGIVDRGTLMLEIFSGEYLAPFFCFKGVPQQLDAECVATSAPAGLFDWFTETSTNQFSLRFPKVTEISQAMTGDEIQSRTTPIHQKCSLILDNISAMTRHEFILKGDSPYSQWIFAGPGSVRFFQQNFLDRLTEVFYHLQWLFQFDQVKAKVKSDFELYENIYHLLAAEHGEDDFSSLLKATYYNAKRVISAGKSSTGERNGP